MLLGSVPLQTLSEISSESRWWPAPMRLEFWSPAEELTPDPSPAGMIFWATSTAGVTAATSLARSQGAPLIMIVNDSELASDLSVEGDGGTVVTLSASSFEDLSHLPRRLWQSLLETWTRCLPLKSLGALPFVNLLSDRERSAFRMSEWIDAAGRGYASPAVMPTPATSVSADLIVRINQLILGGLRNQVPDFDFTHVPTDPEGEASSAARSVISRSAARRRRRAGPLRPAMVTAWPPRTGHDRGRARARRPAAGAGDQRRAHRGGPLTWAPAGDRQPGGDDRGSARPRPPAADACPDRRRLAPRSPSASASRPAAVTAVAGTRHCPPLAEGTASCPSRRRPARHNQRPAAPPSGTTHPAGWSLNCFHNRVCRPMLKRTAPASGPR